MNFLKFVRTCLIAVLCISMSKMPEAVAAEVVSEGMISTIDAVESLGRAELESKVRAGLSREELKTELMKYGISADEVSNRLATLSNAELGRLASEMEKAQYGGDVGGILVTVLLVVLIIYLVKRI